MFPIVVERNVPHATIVRSRCSRCTLRGQYVVDRVQPHVIVPIGRIVRTRSPAHVTIRLDRLVPDSGCHPARRSNDHECRIIRKKCVHGGRQVVPEGISGRKRTGCTLRRVINGPAETADATSLGPGVEEASGASASVSKGTQPTRRFAIVKRIVQIWPGGDCCCPPKILQI